MHVLVTGGAGYIGSVVVELLIRDGHSVVVVDNLVKGHRDAVMPEADFVEADISDEAALTRILRHSGCDAAIHMAAYSLVGESVSAPARYYRNNLTAGFSLLNALRAAGIEKLVFSSTAAVYGESDRQPIDELTPTCPTNPYGETKLAFERALRWYAGAYGLSSTSLRYFNAAGATARHGERHHPETHLIPLVLEAAAGRRPSITIFGGDYPTPDGTCVRDYIHVEDLARAHVLALEAMHGGQCRAYNLGCGGTGYSVREVIASAERVTGTKIPVTIAPRRAGDPAVLVASSDQIQRDLGWSPQRRDLDSIIESAWSWMSSHNAVQAR
jgi:UDP-glucose 4-epimerase